jgi:hypothetical protein
LIQLKTVVHAPTPIPTDRSIAPVVLGVLVNSRRPISTSRESPDIHFSFDSMWGERATS